MADYLYAEDGKIHTRYSELLQCTPGQMDKVIAKREKRMKRFSSGIMEFGTDRHAMWEDEAKGTGKLPHCFGLDWAVSHIEQEFATEILPGIVIHSRPDAVCADIATIVDYKTTQNGKGDYVRSKQLLFYAFQLGLHGIRIKRGVYMCEVWNPERTEILRYENLFRDYSLNDIGAVLPWVKERVALLASAIENRANSLV